jgi:hypothetical protein
MYPNMSVRDDRCETIWQKMTPEEIRSSFYSWLSKRKKQTKRVRACTRGEGIKDISDIYRIKEMALEAPDSIIWLPTRAWRNTLLKSLIEIELMPLPNVAVNASLDPSNTKDEWQSLIDSNWSTNRECSCVLRHTRNCLDIAVCVKQDAFHRRLLTELR